MCEILKSYFVGEDPTTAPQQIAGHVVLEKIQRVVNTLFSTHSPQPQFHMRSNFDANTHSGLCILVQNLFGIIHLSMVLLLKSIKFVGFVQVAEVIAVGTEGITNSLDLGFNRRGLVEDDEADFWDGLIVRIHGFAAKR